MRDLNVLLNDGFYLKDVNKSGVENLSSLALLSAFRSYFNTSQDLVALLHHHDITMLEQNEKDKLCGSRYHVDACDTITHFQHFLELYIKDILKADNPLLVYDANKKPILLYDLVHNNEISERDYDTLKFIEFSDAVERLDKLIDKLDPKYSFLKNHIQMMKHLNNLRNRIAHRGAFIIRPEALDELFCSYILPFIEDVKMNDPDITNVIKRGFNLHNETIDPFNELREEYKKNDVNQQKVYVLKLIIWSAYNNDIPYFPPKEYKDEVDAIFDLDMSWIYDEEKRRVAERSLGEAEYHLNKVDTCPVCGCESLIIENDYNEGDHGEFFPFVYKVYCSHCGFHLEGDLLNPDITELPLPDYKSMY